MIYINFPFDEPSGGGNSFLNRLKEALLNNKKYSSLFNSKVIIFNSHHNVLSTVILKILFRNKYFVHRVDGPMSLYTGKRDPRDEIVYEYAYKNSLPIVTSMGGGYSEKIYDIVEAHCNTFKVMNNLI